MILYRSSVSRGFVSHSKTKLKFSLDVMILLCRSFHQIMALILEEIAIDNETRVSVQKTSEDLQKAEDLHKSALDLAR